MSRAFATVKKDGDDAFKKADFAAAAQYYSEALLIDSITTEEKRNLFSNRAASYISVKQYFNALEDANQCCQIDPKWSRGFARKGDALVGLGRHREAASAFQTAMDLSENKSDAAYKALNDKRNLAAQNGSPLQLISFYVRCAVFIAPIIYMIPFIGSISALAFKVFVFAAIASNLTTIYTKFGKIEFNAAYAQKVLPDPSAQRLLLCIILFVCRNPTFLYMLPIMFAELSASVPSIAKWARTNETTLKAQLAPMWDKYKANFGNVDINTFFSHILQARNLNEITRQLERFSSQIEVINGVFLIIQLVLPTRDFMTLAMWWQYLKMRYNFDKDGDMRAAFYQVDVTISGYLNHRLVPGIVRQVYAQAKSFLSRMAQPPAAGGAGGSGLASKCTIM